MPTWIQCRSQPASTLLLTWLGNGWTTPVSTSSATMAGWGTMARSGRFSGLSWLDGEAPELVDRLAPEPLSSWERSSVVPVCSTLMPVQLSNSATEASKRSASVPVRLLEMVTVAPLWP